jgi:hypothetical protein
MKKHISLISSLCLILILSMIAGCGAPEKDSLEDHEAQFGFSLKGLQIETLKEDHDHAWDGSTCAWLVRLSGEVAGSDFDPAAMEEGVEYRAEQGLNLVNSHYRLDNKKSLLLINRDGHYRSKIWVEKNKIHYFAVIYDQDADTYCCIYGTY